MVIWESLVLVVNAASAIRPVHRFGLFPLQHLSHDS
jgi:hypothetical protein